MDEQGLSELILDNGQEGLRGWIEDNCYKTHGFASSSQSAAWFSFGQEFQLERGLTHREKLSSKSLCWFQPVFTVPNFAEYEFLR
jgi:hypothetical protein